MRPGEIILADEPIACNDGRESISIKVENTSGHKVFVTSHYHFFEANKRLRFPRRAAYGMRLDVPAGTAAGWEPGETREVRLIPLAGRRSVHGFHGLVNGPLSDAGVDASVARAQAEGFLDSEA